MKKLISILFLTIVTLNAWGVKAYPLPLTITQKDGKQLTFQLHGDENFSYTTTTDGVLLFREGNDFYIAVIDDDGTLKPSGVLAHNAGQRTTEEITLIGKQDKDKFFKTNEQTTQPKKGMKKIGMPDYKNLALFPHTGSPKALVILADFADQKFKHDDQTTMEIFNQYLNADGVPTHASDVTLSKNHGSVRQYFSDMSYGKFTPIFEVKAVVHLTGKMEDYGKDSGTKKDVNIGAFVKEVCQLADTSVDFRQYDANEDDKVDLVYIIYAGYGQNSTGAAKETIWPKSGNVTNSSNYDFDEKRVYRYGVHSELNFDPQTMAENPDAFPNGEPWINGIGLFCHEFTHCMGLADIYPTTKYDDNIPDGEPTAQKMGNPAMEYWDLMDGGEYSGNGYYPTAYTAWEREYMGWMQMSVLKDNMRGEEISLKSIDQSSGGTAYKIFPDDNENGNEYVYIQSIQPYGWNYWLSLKRGHGMLVTYVCYDEDAFSLNGDIVNSIPYKSRMTIVPADGEYISSYLSGDGRQYDQATYIASHAGDPFPGTKGVRNIFSIPMIWAGQPMEKPLVNIKERSGGIVTFNYLFEPQEKIEDDSETNVHALEGLESTATDPDIEQIIKTYDHNQTPSYQVFNFQGVAFNFAPYDATNCNVLTICVKPLQNTTLNVTLSSEASSTSSAKGMMDSGTNTTSLSCNSHTVTYELEANRWRTLSVQLHGFSINGVDMSQVTNLTISNGNEEYEGNTIFLEDVYFCETTKRGIATAIRQTDFDSTTKETKIYTLDGRYVGKSTRSLAKGVYIINGKKTVIR